MSDQPEVPTPAPPPPVVRAGDTVPSGVLTILLWNVGHLVVGLLTFAIGIGAILLAVFGLVELVYVIPLAIRARRAGQPARAKGMIIAGCVGILLTATCWGVVLGSLGNMH